MSRRLPPAARRAIEEGTLCYLAVRTSPGPHVTPVVYVLDGGRLWLTTSRSSVKARALREDAAVAGLVRRGNVAVTFRGRARTYDVLDPLSWPAAALRAPRLARAATRFGMRNARFFAGYAVDAARIPFAWAPPGRVFVGVDLLAGHVLDQAEDRAVASWGEWLGTAGARPRYPASYRSLPPSRGLDLRAPREVRDGIGAEGLGALAMDSGEALTVLPAAWRRVPREGAYDAILPVAHLELAGAAERRPAALCVDRLSSWRASEMRGMLLAGQGQAFTTARTQRGWDALRRRIGVGEDGSGERDTALVRIRPSRVVWWRGWTGGSASAVVRRRPRS